MRPLAPIYNHRVPEFMKTQVEFNPNQKRNSNPKRKLQPRLPIDRPMPRLTGPVDRAYPRANPLQSVDRGRSTAPTCAHPCTPIDRAGRPASSTGRPRRRPGAQFASPCAVSHSFVVRSLCYLLPSPPSPLSPLSQQFIHVFMFLSVLNIFVASDLTNLTFSKDYFKRMSQDSEGG